MPSTIEDNELDALVDLWNSLSKEWVHAKGIVSEIVNKIVKYETPPPWSIIILITYDERDLPGLKEFTSYIKKLRKIISNLVSAWHKHVNILR